MYSSLKTTSHVKLSSYHLCVASTKAMGTMSLCSLTPAQTSMSNFISNHPHLTLLETHCNTIKDLNKIHAHLIKTGLSKHPIAISRVLAFAATSHVADIRYAHSIFTSIHNPNLFMWNTIIRGFSQSWAPLTAILLFVDMLTSSGMEPQRLTYPSLFKAYANLGLAQCGAQLHARVIKLGLHSDHFIRNTIIHMYANNGFLREAFKVFDEGQNSDVVAWNSMIMGLAKCREIDEARRLFDKMGVKVMKNAISWNSMISGCVRNDKFVEAINLFGRMQEDGFKASEFTMVSLLNACANLGSLEKGELVHDHMCENGFELNVIVVTAIVDMYCKCGAIDKAIQIFERTPIKGLSTWNSMILGLANNGRETDTIQLFSDLVSSGMVPDDVTFLGVLTACCYNGDVDKATDYFLLMTQRYQIEPSIKHYNCMVSILGQAGLLKEAEQLIGEMPVKADAIIWGSLLSACRKHGNVDMGIWASKNINEIDPNDTGAYVLMSNVYSASGEFQNAIKQRISMKDRQVCKEKGGSSIQINGEVEEFVSGGMLNPEMNDLMFLIHSNYEGEKLASEELEMWEIN
ncbi:pentatricopeptide repeat-containing protein At2g42920, chloroplastic [Silene latifolia]|uniref:pentatricopeptide repeat-containing protein At2g42920, chloroplastic n=1 Tax=Silene latifolia TaxID=37657 RepID=UPI003D775F70